MRTQVQATTAETTSATIKLISTIAWEIPRGGYGPNGIFIKVGCRGNLVASGYTACRLPRDKN